MIVTIIITMPSNNNRQKQKQSKPLVTTLYNYHDKKPTEWKTNRNEPGSYTTGEEYLGERKRPV